MAADSASESVAVQSSEVGDSELRFGAAPERSGDAVLRLHNDTDMHVAYKLHTTDRAKLMPSARLGYLRPHSTTPVPVHWSATAGALHTPHRGHRIDIYTLDANKADASVGTGGGGRSVVSAQDCFAALSARGVDTRKHHAFVHVTHGHGDRAESASRASSTTGTTAATGATSEGSASATSTMGTAVTAASHTDAMSTRSQFTADAADSPSAPFTTGTTLSELQVATGRSADDQTAVEMLAIDAMDSRTQSAATEGEAQPPSARRVSFVTEPPQRAPQPQPAASLRHRLAQWVERTIRGHREPTNEELSLRTAVGTLSRRDAADADTKRRLKWRNRLADMLFGRYTDATDAEEQRHSRSRSHSRSQRKGDKSAKSKRGGVWSRLRAMFTRRPAAKAEAGSA